jgi:hypothetical protein
MNCDLSGHPEDLSNGNRPSFVPYVAAVAHLIIRRREKTARTFAADVGTSWRNVECCARTYRAFKNAPRRAFLTLTHHRFAPRSEYPQRARIYRTLEKRQRCPFLTFTYCHKAAPSLTTPGLTW